MPQLVDILQYKLTLDDREFVAGAGGADAAALGLANSIGGVLVGAVGALGAALGAVKIGEFLKDATLTAARTEVLGTVLEVVGENAGVSTGQLALLEEQVKSLGITTQGARESMIKFIQSGLPLEKLTQLARVAQNSAIIAQTTSAEALDRLVRGIQTQQIELLRSAGVFVSIEQSLAAFAKSANRAANELTPVEKQTIILNAVLAQGTKVAGSYERAMEDAGKKMTSLPRIFEETGNAIGVFFLPILEKAVDILGKVGQGVNDLLTNDIIQAARAAAGKGDINTQQEALNALLEKRERITATIARNEKIIEESLKARSLLATQGTSIASFLMAAPITEKLKRDLEEINRLIEGLTFALDPKKLTRGLLPFDPKAVLPAVPEVIELPVKAVIDDGSEEFFQALLDDEFEKQQTIVFDFKLKGSGVLNAFQDEIDATNEKYKRLKKTIGDGGLFEGPQSDINQERDRLDSINEAATAVREKLERAFRDVEIVASSVFRAIGIQGAQVFDDLLSSLEGFSTGNIAGGIAGAIGGLAGIFSGGDSFRQSTADLIRSQNLLIDTIENWRDTIFALSERDRAEQLDAAREALSLLDRRGGQVAEGAVAQARAILEGIGFNTDNLSIQELVDLATDILSNLGDLGVTGRQIVDATDAVARQSLVDRAQTLDQAQFLVRTFAENFNISQQEQIDLLQSVMERIGDQLTPAEFVELTNAIKELQTGADTGSVQTERSIARITERQADSLVAGLSTLDLHLQEGFAATVDMLGSLLDAFTRVTGIAGSSDVNVYIGTISAPAVTAADIASNLAPALKRELRAAGGTALGSR